jgi:hypothetical protein
MINKILKIKKYSDDKISKTETKFKNLNLDYFYIDKYTVQLDYQNSFKMKKLNGEVYNFSCRKNIEVNSATVKPIAIAVNKAYNQIFKMNKLRFPQGYNFIAKLIFKVGDSKNDVISVVFRDDMSISNVENEVRYKIVEKFHSNNSSILAIFDSVSFYTFGLETKGGCSDRHKNCNKFHYKDRTIKLISPKSTNNNCLFMCFAYFLKLKGNTLKFDDIRNKLNIPEGKIHIKEINKISDHFNTGFILLNEKQEIILYKDIVNQPKVHIMLLNEHYYVVESIDYKKCKSCGQRLRDDNDDHKCNPKNITYFNRKVCGKQDYVAMTDCREKEKIDKDSMIFFDLETFQENIRHVPYACGWCIGEGEVNINYGKDCMNSFIDELLVCENKTICAYNGSGFDFYLLIDILTERGVNIENLILSNGNILSFKFGKNNKVFDLYRFIMTGLDKACTAYKIVNKKMKFDVLKIKSWQLSEEYRHEVEPYLQYDVLSLRELFYTFNDSMFELDSVNITKFVTLSHMAYALWSSTLEHEIEIPDMEKYDFEKLGTYGGRCYPVQQKYKSQYYDDIKSGKMSYEELKKTLMFIFNADATSLYPASMCGYELCKVRYPIGKSRWSEKGKEEYDNNKLGYYNIEFKCPKNIRAPILPRKNNGGLEWSLYDGQGVYT